MTASTGPRRSTGSPCTTPRSADAGRILDRSPVFIEQIAPRPLLSSGHSTEARANDEYKRRGGRTTELRNLPRAGYAAALRTDPIGHERRPEWIWRERKLQALRVKVGDEVFFRILRTWLAEHRYGNATTAGFMAQAERESGSEP